MNILATKRSSGIICCKDFGTEFRAMMVRKRYTYTYSDFVHGFWANKDSELLKLFNGMTMEEKKDIYSMSFRTMWNRIWGGKLTHYYGMCETKFFELVTPDTGKRLRRLIAESVNGETLWEAPKGRKKNAAENDLQCARREFEEETGLDKDDYKVYPQSKVVIDYVDNGVRYINRYYIAYMASDKKVRIDLTNTDQCAELSDIRWMSLADIARVDRLSRFYFKVKSSFNYIKNLNSSYHTPWSS